MDENGEVMAICPRCGATHVRRLGLCGVCSRTVCEHCGNMHIIHGDRRMTHHDCLRKDTDSFSMIKFVE